MKKIIFLIAFILPFLLLSCRKDSSVAPLQSEIVVLGHGGMGISGSYPMNSFESISQCLSLGANGSEIDVQMTMDGVLVAFHDENLTDNTNLYQMVNDFDWDMLKDVYYDAAPYLRSSLISLDELFSHIPNVQKYTFSFDCKLYTHQSILEPYYSDFIEAIAAIADKYHLQNNIIIESDRLDFLKAFSEKYPAFRLLYYASDFENGLKMARLLNLEGLSMATQKISKEQVAIAHENDLLVCLWNLQTASDNKETLAKQPDFVQADKLSNLLFQLQDQMFR